MTGLLEDAAINAALARVVKGARWLELDRLALEKGRKAAEATLGVTR